MTRHNDSRVEQNQWASVDEDTEERPVDVDYWKHEYDDESDRGGNSLGLAICIAVLFYGTLFAFAMLGGM